MDNQWSLHMSRHVTSHFTKKVVKKWKMTHERWETSDCRWKQPSLDYSFTYSKMRTDRLPTFFVWFVLFCSHFSQCSFKFAMAGEIDSQSQYVRTVNHTVLRWPFTYGTGRRTVVQLLYVHMYNTYCGTDAYVVQIVLLYIVLRFCTNGK